MSLDNIKIQANDIEEKIEKGEDITEDKKEFLKEVGIELQSSFGEKAKIILEALLVPGSSFEYLENVLKLNFGDGFFNDKPELKELLDISNQIIKKINSIKKNIKSIKEGESNIENINNFETVQDNYFDNIDVPENLNESDFGEKIKEIFKGDILPYYILIRAYFKQYYNGKNEIFMERYGNSKDEEHINELFKSNDNLGDINSIIQNLFHIYENKNNDIGVKAVLKMMQNDKANKDLAIELVRKNLNNIRKMHEGENGLKDDELLIEVYGARLISSSSKLSSFVNKLAA